MKRIINLALSCRFGNRTMAKKNLKKIVLCCILVAILVMLVRLYCNGLDSGHLAHGIVSKNSYEYKFSNNETATFTYDHLTPLIFVGGMPRSGTTLMRALLDAHSEIRCGEETRIIPRILSLKNQWIRSKKEADRLLEGGVTNEVINSAMAAFIIEIIVKHGEPAPRLCNKDPFTLKYMVELADMFPNARFLLMVRDGRAVVHSVMSRKVTITGFDLDNFEASLQKWNSIISSMYTQCQKVGPTKCMMVFYEQLVLHPAQVMTDVLKFLEIPWDERVMHHQDYINKPGGISLSKSERSTDQVVKPVNLEALTKWVDHVPDNVKKNIRRLAPMLEKLGYDPDGYPPNYGIPDASVWNQTNQVLKNSQYWINKAAEVHSKIDKNNTSAKNPFNSLV